MKFSRTISDLHVRYNSILFPFDIEPFLQNLPGLGYILAADASRAVASVPFMQRLASSGALATKGDVTFWLAYDRNSLGVRGPDSQILVEEMETLEHLISEELKFGSQENALFYEMQYEVRIESNTNPLYAMEKQFADLPVIQAIQGIWNNPVANFTLRLVPPEVEPNNADWFELRVEPEVLQPSRFWLLHILYRNQNRDKTFGVAQDAANLSERLISALDG